MNATWLRRWTIRLGLVSLVVLLFPALVVITLISVIGIPLGLALMACPFLFTVLALASVVHRLHGRDGPLAVSASLGAALLLLAAVAGLANTRLDRRADELLAGDVDALDKPLRVETLGLVEFDHRWSRGQTRCGELCQLLLLSGDARRVIAVEKKYGDTEWGEDTPGLAYRLEERAVCPEVHLADRGYRGSPDGEDPADVLRLAIASGRCLIEEEATLAEADAVLVLGRLHRGQSAVRAGLSLFADTVTADRASVHLREGESAVEGKDLVERYRWTGVTVLRHPIVPLPTLVGGAELRMVPGFQRRSQVRNARDFAPDRINPVLFARSELGLGLEVAAPSSPTLLIERGLAAPGPLPPSLQQVIEDYFEALGRRREVDEATRQLALRILADPRVVAPRRTAALVRASAKAGRQANVELADVLFGKLKTTDPTLREDHPTYLGYPAAYLANAIRQLTQEAVAAHRRELEDLARDPARRLRAHPALVHLASFGPEVMPTLLHLLDEACVLRQAAVDRSKSSRERREIEDWQNVYRAGLLGLCRLGGQASAALERFRARARDESLPTGGSNRKLLMTTLLRLGAREDEIRRMLLADDASEREREDFRRDFDRARSRGDCGN